MNDEKITALEQIIKNKYNNTCSIVVLKNNKKVYENYFNNCNSDSTIHIYSVTKSIVSILIGIAIDKGFIKSINEKILNYFPDYIVDKQEKTLPNITLKDMMTMTAPYKYNPTSPPYIEYFTSNNWTKFSLDMLGGKGKIGEFSYAPLIGPDIFCSILSKTTNKPVLDFAKENLFTPLGITVDNNIVFHNQQEQFEFYQSTNMSGWVTDSTGINAGGWGLTLKACDMAKIGQLYLNNGIYNNKQIISSNWIKESTTKHSQFNNLSYGYLWWIIDENSYAALGDGGNTIYVDTDKKIVISITCTFVPNAPDRIELIKRYIEPIFDTFE